MTWLTQLLVAYAITAQASHVQPATAWAWSATIVEESRRHRVDPFLVVAVAKRESNLRPGAKGRTDDHGLMQLHWDESAPWLRGVSSRRQLLDPHVNIRAGIHAMAWWRGYCVRKGLPHGDAWIGHYKWGGRVKDGGYGARTLAVYEVITGDVYRAPSRFYVDNGSQ